MTDLSMEICSRFRDARRQRRWSQDDLAKRVGCKQSAISMFEKGMVTKVSEETVRKMAAELSVSLEPAAGVEDAGETAADAAVETVAGGFCSDCACPSNLPYLVGDRLFFRPSAFQRGRFCVHCGEVLQTRCPACGAPLNAGACCAVCGTGYVPAIAPAAADLGEWAQRRRSLARELGIVN